MSQENLTPPQGPNAKESAPDAIRAGIANLATGLEVVEAEGRQLPQINLDWPFKQLGRELGQLARGTNFFRRGQDFVTVDPRDGELRGMTNERFCSYVEELCWPFKIKGREFAPSFTRFPRELAGQILASDDFRAHCRELHTVHEAALPAWRGTGESRTVDLSPTGYDSETKVFSVGSLDYERNLDPGEAQEWLLETCGAFPWAEAVEHPKHVLQCRSFAAHVAGMLAPYCSHLLGDHARRPMFGYLANQAGSGKTRLAQMALAPVYGEPCATNADQRPDELEKIISTAALDQRPYLFLDDCGNFKSRALNMLLTSGRISTRIMGQSKMPDVPNRMQLFLTGNAVEIGHELLRRSLLVDLFWPGDVLQRTFPKTITEEWLYSRETRSRFLAVLWAFVRHWRDHHNMKRFDEAKRPSFESFAEIVGSIVLGSDFGNPFGHREALLGGDEEGEALKGLLATIAGEVADPESSPEYRPKDIAEKAEALGLLDMIVPYAKDQHKALGHRLKLLRGRQIRDTQGRLFEFGRRAGNKGAIYPLVFLKP